MKNERIVFALNVILLTEYSCTCKLISECTKNCYSAAILLIDTV